MVDTYEYHHQNLVMCPISVMFGEEDTLHTREEFLDWKAVAGKDFDFKAFPGGHMYLGHESQQVVEYLSNSLMSSGPL